jgi:hypothetical protein
MKISQPLAFALTGWLAGLVVTVGLGFYWPTVFPAIVQVQHYYGAGPNMFVIVAFALLSASPGGLIGGLIGNRIPKEGGKTEQYIMSAIFGVLFALPFSCMSLWFFTGW